MQALPRRALVRQFSIFDRIRSKPKVTQEALVLFEDLADPKDVVLQYAQCRKTHLPHDARVWNALGVKASGMLKFFTLQDISVILGAMAHHRWKDQALLRGLAEAMKFQFEARRVQIGTLAKCCQALRRLNYCPRARVLRGMIPASLERLNTHRVASNDAALLLRFASHFRLDEMRLVWNSTVFVNRLHGICLAKVGQMRHIEMAHVSRAMVELERDDIQMFDTICKQFMRKSEQLPLSVLFFFCVSMMKSHSVFRPPKIFFDIVEEKVNGQITELKPSEIAFALTLVSRYSVGVSSLTNKLLSAVETNLYNFPAHHLATALSAIASIEAKPSDYLLRTIPTLVIAGPHQPQCLLAYYALLRHHDEVELKETCRAELLRVLRSGPDAQAPRKDNLLVPKYPKQPVEHEEVGGVDEEPSSRSSKGNLRLDPDQLDALREMEAEQPLGEDAEGEQRAPKRRASESRWSAEKLDPSQLDALRELEGGKSRPRGARASQLLKVRSAEQMWFDRVLDGKHPAAFRIRRRLRKLEKDAPTMPDEGPRPFRGNPKKKKKRKQKISAINLKGEFPYEWRRRRRSALARFQEVGDGGFIEHDTASALTAHDVVRLGRFVSDPEVLLELATFCAQRPQPLDMLTRLTRSLGPLPPLRKLFQNHRRTARLSRDVTLQLGSALIQAGRFDPLPVDLLRVWSLALTDEALEQLSVPALIQLGATLHALGEPAPALVTKHLMRRAVEVSHKVVPLVATAQTLGGDVDQLCNKLHIPKAMLHKHLEETRSAPLIP